MNKHLTLKQPPVFYLACFTSMLERYGFYALSYLLVLYVKAVFSMTDTAAFTLFAVFNAFVYLTPALGGYLADNFFGIRRTIILGLILEASGLTLLAMPTIPALPPHTALTLGLALLIAGTGFFKTCPTNLLGRAYEENDPRIDGGFTWYYMFINFGSCAATISVGFIQHYLSWRTAFSIAAISVWLSLCIYFLMRHLAEKRDSDVGHRSLPKKNMFIIGVGTILAIFATAYLLDHFMLSELVFIIAGFVLFTYFIYEIIRSPRDEKFSIVACLLLIVMGFAFFLMYYQIFTSFTLYLDRCIDHKLFGLYIPTVVFQMLNPFWVIILSPVLAHTYLYLAKKKGGDLPVTVKFPLGILFCTLCFFILAISTLFVSPQSLISPFWYVAGIGSLSLGELLISALGVAMVTRIAPQRLYGIMMGSWFLLSTALASAASGRLAALTSVPHSLLHDKAALLHAYASGFLKIGSIGTAATVIAFIIGPFVRRIAKLD